MSFFLKKLTPIFLFLLTLSFTKPLFATCWGKIDISPTYVHVDVLKSKKTIHRMDLPAFRADFSGRFKELILVRPTLTYGYGKNRDQIAQVGCGIGVCLPYGKKWVFTPLAGVNWGNMRTQVAVKIPLLVGENLYSFYHFKFKQTSRSLSPYLGWETCYTFCPGWRLTGSVQYAYSRTQTTIKGQGKDKAHSEGFSYSALLEHDLNERTSINLGGAYNQSLTKEKHGMRIWGFKCGLSYWF